MGKLIQEAVVGDWYRLPRSDEFEVVAVDNHHGTVEVQHFDGTVEEIDFETWSEIEPEPSSPPDTYAGAFDIEPEDYAFDGGSATVLNGWDNPLDRIDLL